MYRIFGRNLQGVEAIRAEHVKEIVPYVRVCEERRQFLIISRATEICERLLIISFMITNIFYTNRDFSRKSREQERMKLMSGEKKP
jgi:hypothetical protein